MVQAQCRATRALSIYCFSLPLFYPSRPSSDSSSSSNRCFFFSPVTVVVPRRPVAKFASSNSFFLFSLSTAPPVRNSPRSTFFYRNSGLITSRAARARRREGIKRTRARAVLTEAITRVRSRSRGTIEHLVKVVGPGTTGFKC